MGILCCGKYQPQFSVFWNNGDLFLAHTAYTIQVGVYSVVYRVSGNQTLEATLPQIQSVMMKERKWIEYDQPCADSRKCCTSTGGASNCISLHKGNHSARLNIRGIREYYPTSCLEERKMKCSSVVLMPTTIPFKSSNTL